jgi:predicted TIM-barrel fold metal-dependent hydrolase
VIRPVVIPKYAAVPVFNECAHAAYPAPLAALQAFAPMSQYLYGTDFPIDPMESTANLLPSAKLPSDVRLAMDRGNAERLWPRFKA